MSSKKKAIGMHRFRAKWPSWLFTLFSWIIVVITAIRTTKARLPHVKRTPEDEESIAPPPRTSQEARTVPTTEDHWGKVEDTREEPTSTADGPRTPERAYLRQSMSHHEELEAWCAMEHRIRNSRLSSLLDSPQSFVSREGSETSNFSALAFGLKKTPSASKRCPRNMGEMSIAKLTSGVADGAWNSR